MTRVRMMFAMAGAIAMSGLVQATDALAQQARPDLIDPVHRGYYKRSGPGFACVIGPSESADVEENVTVSPATGVSGVARNDAEGGAFTRTVAASMS